ncbi:serine protease [Sphingomonas bacterium]|uniref:S1 family peptidase n=1 Tax=Sphingomonas bacterium TaxID=1895847 RepID=UPI00262BF928|nr:serine protease [Sphingomonas bacterium]
MPDLSFAQEMLSATVFLYPTVEDAEHGKKYGGSGAVIGVPVPGRPDIFYMYVVTNWHVACDGGNSVVRYTDRNGGSHIIESDPSEWVFIPGGPDLAAIPLLAPVSQPRPMTIPATKFVGDKYEVFIGEDVYMAGRFVDYDGHLTNKPALRFGAISMLEADVLQPTGYRGPSVVVDMHSRSGFSGSPVYAYRPMGMTVDGRMANQLISDGKEQPIVSKRTWGTGTQTQIRFLGLQWGQFPESWEVGPHRKPEEASLVESGGSITGFSGMSCVVPASDITRLLNLPALKNVRDNLPQAVLNAIPIPEGEGA